MLIYIYSKMLSHMTVCLRYKSTCDPISNFAKLIEFLPSNILLEIADGRLSALQF